MNDVRGWFFGWLDRHKKRNHHNGWRALDDDGSSLMFFLGWIRAFEERGVTEADAEAASERMARGEPLFPEHHLGRLLAIASPLVAARESEARWRSRRLEAEADREAKAARARMREAWLALPEGERAGAIRSIGARYPGIGKMPRMAERFAIEEWAGAELPPPWPAARQSPAGRWDEAEEETPEPPLTEAQAAFVAGLSPEQRGCLFALKRARRAEILAFPEGGEADRMLRRVVLAELERCIGPVVPAEAV